METGPRLIQEGSKPSCLWGPRPSNTRGTTASDAENQRAPGSWQACRGSWGPRAAGTGLQGQPADMGPGDQARTRHLENLGRTL